MAAITTQIYVNKIQGQTVGIDEFCQLWIPKLYGVLPGEYGYKKACIVELRRLLNNTVSFRSIEVNWRWDGGQKKYPAYIDPYLVLAHQLYLIKEALGVLPKYSSDDE